MTALGLRSGRIEREFDRVCGPGAAFGRYLARNCEYTKNGVDPIEFHPQPAAGRRQLPRFDPAFAATSTARARRAHLLRHRGDRSRQRTSDDRDRRHSTPTTTMTATPTETTVAATATRTNTPRATVTRTPLPPKTGSGPDMGGDSASPFVAIAFLRWPQAARASRSRIGEIMAKDRTADGEPGPARPCTAMPGCLGHDGDGGRTDDHQPAVPGPRAPGRRARRRRGAEGCIGTAGLKACDVRLIMLFLAILVATINGT